MSFNKKYPEKQGIFLHLLFSIRITTNMHPNGE